MNYIAVVALIITSLGCAAAQADEPRDIPRHLSGNQQDRVMKEAIAPYVAKARATYPAAKKRFLAGLPPNQWFMVWLLFEEVDLQKFGFHDEYAYVVVDSIRDGKIYGRVNSRLADLKHLHYGDHVQIAESRVLNWAILRSDGSAEGDYVVHFLEHWKPLTR